MWLLRRPKIKREFKLSDVRAELAGKFWRDDLWLDRILVANNECPKKECRRPLEYRGVSNESEYRAYGICESCDYARLFWDETPETAAAKKNLSRHAA